MTKNNIKYTVFAMILVITLMSPSMQMAQSQNMLTSLDEKTFAIPFGGDSNHSPSTSLSGSSQVFAKPVLGVPLPKNAINTPDGGYVTIPTPLDENGKPLNISYEVGTVQYPTGNIVPACRGPASGLYQEGNTWTVTSNAQTMGSAEQWNMPTGTLNSGTSVGIYYNPINFWNNGATSLGDYDFFQVSYGIGNNLSLGTGWTMVFSQISGGTRIYPDIKMTAITVSPGSSYKVAAMLQPYPMANPPAYVVQVTLGANSWIYSKPLQANYPTILGQLSQFSSYNDEWLKTSGTSTNYLSDTNSSPQIIKDVSNTAVYDGSLVTAMVTSDTNTSVPGQPTLTTYDILSPSPGNTKPYNDLEECTSWP